MVVGVCEMATFHIAKKQESTYFWDDPNLLLFLFLLQRNLHFKLFFISVQNSGNSNSMEAQGFGVERDRKQEIQK